MTQVDHIYVLLPCRSLLVFFHLQIMLSRLYSGLKSKDRHFIREYLGQSDISFSI
jgi:hypothetical protein